MGATAPPAVLQVPGRGGGRGGGEGRGAPEEAGGGGGFGFAGVVGEGRGGREPGGGIDIGRRGGGVGVGGGGGGGGLGPATPVVKAAPPDAVAADSVARNWHQSLTLRRCLSLLQFIGWDDAAKLAVLSERQFQSVLGQIGMVESAVVSRDAILAALHARH